ncbi:hypothetical protein DAPPUDRAFT_112670 [Daphnia pulex]|uniref:Uncharacterized protein n=1 Tax=Daphnia pulex TaxID=6669 RepID=E9HCQ9_DAPPU|nr:hypothetical protein DAPPUDRAFT_112670 [Daphnia pulex]|eukprot:EFX70473.1 hypothetical protein DAPPUDRAFT_112670 [Daphnia pulex]
MNRTVCYESSSRSCVKDDTLMVWYTVPKRFQCKPGTSVLISSIGNPENLVTVLTVEADANGAGNISDDQPGITILRILKTVGVALGVALVVTFIAPIIIYFLLCCIGFTCSGVRGGSYAAVRQSDYGDVEAGSCFSCAQSMGACGNMGRNVLIGLIFGILAGAIAGYYAWFYFL